MTLPYATLDGHPTTFVEVHVAAVGPWWADVDCSEAPELSGPVILRVGDLELWGTVDAGAAGSFGIQRRVRLVAGGGGWSTLLPAKAYHNDGGVSALLVAQDAAREAGEVLGAVTPAVARLGVDYVRQSGPAARVLEEAIGGVEWWVGYDGITAVGSRGTVDASPGAYELLDYEPRHRVALLAVDDLRKVVIGTRLSERFDEACTARELVITVLADSSRVRVWTGDSRTTRMAGLFRAIIERATDAKLHGMWKYRVVRMSGAESDTRAELQAMSRAEGLPDVLPISFMMGIPGVHANLTPGTEVVVQFLEGKRTQPMITHFAGKDGPGFVPVAMTIGSVGDGNAAARAGDAVRVTIPIGTFLTAASGGVLNPAPVEVDGTITAGSNIVSIG